MSKADKKYKVRLYCPQCGERLDKTDILQGDSKVVGKSYWCTKCDWLYDMYSVKEDAELLVFGDAIQVRAKYGLKRTILRLLSYTELNENGMKPYTLERMWRSTLSVRLTNKIPTEIPYEMVRITELYKLNMNQSNYECDRIFSPFDFGDRINKMLKWGVDKGLVRYNPIDKVYHIYTEEEMAVGGFLDYANRVLEDKVSRKERISKGAKQFKCTHCSSVVNLNDITAFSSELSRREFDISGLCQKCQNLVFGK